MTADRYRFAGLLLVAAALATLAGCEGITSYDPADPVVVSVEAGADLNQYSGEPHSLAVYLYKVEDSTLFTSAEEGALVADVGKPVPGGIVHQMRTFSPGETAEWKIGAMIHERFQWLGIYTAYREPEGSRTTVVEIPRSGEIRLVLGPRGVKEFAEKK